MTNIKSCVIMSIVDYGEMSERLKEPVLKTGDVRASVGSNPTLSSRRNDLLMQVVFLVLFALRQVILLYSVIYVASSIAFGR